MGKCNQRRNVGIPCVGGEHIDIDILGNGSAHTEFIVEEQQCNGRNQPDVFIPLQKRADIANKANADLFISIHTNSAEKKEPRGVETFILGTDRMEANLDVAMRENAVIKLEADYNTTYQGFDPNSIDSYIMFELMQNSYM
ncbi:MAG: N-acetylmuramoyl-L-alanine amidase, partial [Bacteroidales bacterium]|nr:N-acetylmuramoyl-L-alanine amidase [Bacteroidales bacterium]